MTGDDVRRRLEQAKPEEWQKLNQLAREIDRDARDALTAIARAWATGDDAQRGKSREVLSACDELAIKTWLGTSQDVAGRRGIEALEYAVAAYNGFERRVVERLTGLFDNKSNVPLPVPQRPVEEKELPSRVCDEAYLLIRRLTKSDEPEIVHEMTRREFLRDEAANRDAEIANYRKTAKWRRYVDEEVEAELRGAGP